MFEIFIPLINSFQIIMLLVVLHREKLQFLHKVEKKRFLPVLAKQLDRLLRSDYKNILHKRYPRFGLFFFRRSSTKSGTVIKFDKCTQPFDKCLRSNYPFYLGKNIFAVEIQHGRCIKIVDIISRIT